MSNGVSLAGRGQAGQFFNQLGNQGQQGGPQGSPQGNPQGNPFAAPPPIFGTPQAQGPIVGDQLSSPGAYAPPPLALPNGTSPYNQQTGFNLLAGPGGENVLSAQAHQFFNQLGNQGQQGSPQGNPFAAPPPILSNGVSLAGRGQAGQTGSVAQQPLIPPTPQYIPPNKETGQPIGNPFNSGFRIPGRGLLN